MYYLVSCLFVVVVVVVFQPYLAIQNKNNIETTSYICKT